MASKQTTQKGIVPYKFLTRNLRISPRDREGSYLRLTFRQICVKRVYLKNIIDPRRDNWEPEPDTPEINYKAFRNTKIFKVLKTFKVSSYVQFDWLESLKYSKNLRTFSINSPFFVIDIDKVILYLKRLPVTIQICVVNIYVRAVFKEKQICLLAKCIRRYPNLENFQRAISCSWKRSKDFIIKELRTCSQSALRLNKVKGFFYSGISSETSELQKIMRMDQIYPGITGLDIVLDDNIPNYRQFEPFFQRTDDFDGFLPDWQDMSIHQREAYQMIQGEITRKDRLEDGPNQKKVENLATEYNPFLTDRNFLAKCRMKEEIKPFYHFELFPDLKKLRFSYWGILYPLGSFVVEGFAALKKLEDLTIYFRGRPIGILYLFKGLLQLPLLKRFSLTMDSLENEDWELFKQFLRSQKSLESFSLEVRNPPSTTSDSLQQNAHLENLIMSFENLPSLKSLKLKSDYWYLETLSRGLAQLKMMNQLHILSIKAIDASISNKGNSCQRVEGLCKFIKNQKGSLKKFHISLPLVTDDGILTHTLRAISELFQLRKLKIRIQSTFYYSSTTHIKSYIEQRLGDFVPLGPQKDTEAWSPNVQPLKRLQNLETFILIVKMEFLGENELNLWLVDALKAVSNLPKLRRIFMFIYPEEPFGLLPKKMITPIFGLKDTLDVEIGFDDHDESEDSLSESAKSQLDRAVCRMRQKQSTRCDLMF